MQAARIARHDRDRRYAPCHARYGDCGSGNRHGNCPGIRGNRVVGERVFVRIVEERRHVHADCLSGVHRLFGQRTDGDGWAIANRDLEGLGGRQPLRVAGRDRDSCVAASRSIDLEEVVRYGERRHSGSGDRRRVGQSVAVRVVEVQRHVHGEHLAGIQRLIRDHAPGLRGAIGHRDPEDVLRSQTARVGCGHGHVGRALANRADGERAGRQRGQDNFGICCRDLVAQSLSVGFGEKGRHVNHGIPAHDDRLIRHRPAGHRRPVGHGYRKGLLALQASWVDRRHGHNRVSRTQCRDRDRTSHRRGRGNAGVRGQCGIGQ